MEQDQKLVPSSPSVFLYIIFSFSLIISLLVPYSVVVMLDNVFKPGFSTDGFGFFAFIPILFCVVFGIALIIVFKFELKHNPSRMARLIFRILVTAVFLAIIFMGFGLTREQIPYNYEEIDLALKNNKASVDFTSSIKTELVNPWIKGQATSVDNSDGDVIWKENLGTIQLSLTLGAPAWIKLDGVTNKSFDVIKFDYKLISEVGSAGELYVYVDKELVSVVWVRDDNDVHTSGYIKISPEFLPSTHSLRFIYTDNLSNRNHSTVEISNIVIGTSI